MERPLTLQPVLNQLSHAEVPKCCLRSASVGLAQDSPLLFTQSATKAAQRSTDVRRGPCRTCLRLWRIPLGFSLDCAKHLETPSVVIERFTNTS